MSLVKAMATVAGLTIVSRIAGFTRDILTAAILGAGPVADAFFVALKLPNLFRRVTAEGAFSVSFVPLYNAKMEKEGEQAANEFAGTALSLMAWGLTAFTIVVIWAMPWVIRAIAPGFGDDPLRYGMAVELSRVTFPYLVLISLTAALGGVLNSHDRFAPFAAAPIFFNLSLIGFLLLSGYGFDTPGHAMAWGVFAAGFIQFGLLLLSIRRAGIRIPVPRVPRLDADIKKLFRLMGPGIIGAGVVQINLFADVIIASLLERGSISYLYYADRLNQLPLGVVGIAVGTALLPMLSRSMAAGDKAESRRLFNRALESCFLLALPACTGLFVLAYPIVLALFERGAFDNHATVMTAYAVTAYAIGMPAYVAVKVFSTAFWASHDTRTPVIISIITTSCNIFLSLFLIFVVKLGVVGIALATGVAGWLQIGLLAWRLQGHGNLSFDTRLKKNLMKILMSCALMALVIFGLKTWLAPFYMNAGNLGEILAMLALVGSGVIVYGLAVTLSGAFEAKELAALFSKRAISKETRQ